MIAAGVPLIQALQMVSRNTSMRHSRKNISIILEHLNNGLSFSDAMQHVPGWLPEFDNALLSAGEQSGRLDATFRYLGDYYASRALIIRDALSSLILPTVNLHVFLLVFPLGYLILFVMGIVNNNYSQCIPFILEKFAVYGALWGCIVFFVFASQGKRGERWRALLEHLNQAVPMLRTALKYLVLYRLTTALGALVAAGVSIVKSWPLAGAASGSPHLKTRIAEWKGDLESGLTPSELVNQTKYFPEMFMNLYHTGEISGQLDDSLKRMQAYYREEGFRILRSFMRIFSGTVYALIAIMIAYNVIRFYVNYFSRALGGF